MQMPIDRLLGLKIQSLLEIDHPVGCTHNGMFRRVSAIDWVDGNGLFLIHRDTERTDLSEVRTLINDPRMSIDRIAIERAFETIPGADKAFDHLTGISHLKETYLNYRLRKEQFAVGNIYAATALQPDADVVRFPVDVPVQVVCLEVYDPPRTSTVRNPELGDLIYALFVDGDERLYYSVELTDITLVVDSRSETVVNT